LSLHSPVTHPFGSSGRAQLTFASALLALRVPPWWNEARECTEIILIQFHPPGRAQLTFAAALLALRVPPWWNEARECTEIILI
jgi:hypothetical protein